MAPFLPGLAGSLCPRLCSCVCWCHHVSVSPCPGVTVSWCHQLAFPWESVSPGMCATGDEPSAATLVTTRSNSTLVLQNIWVLIERSNQRRLLHPPCKSSSRSRKLWL